MMKLSVFAGDLYRKSEFREKVIRLKPTNCTSGAGPALLQKQSISRAFLDAKNQEASNHELGSEHDKKVIERTTIST